MRKYVIMGVQGSGKGTQARLLKEDFDLVHISVGDILRWQIQSHTHLGAQVKRVMDAGQLVSDDIVSQVIEHRLREHDWNYGFILDGFPRNVPQAEFLIARYDVDALILVEVPDKVVFDRILARRLCSGCGLDYNLIHHRPAVENVCDVCKGRLVARPDDMPDAVHARIAEYRVRTEPVIDVLRRRMRVVEVDGTQRPEAVQVAIRTQLGLPVAAREPALAQV